MTIFDPNQLANQFVIAAPALAGEYVLRLTATDTPTGDERTDTVILTLDAPYPRLRPGVEPTDSLLSVVGIVG